MTNPDRGDLWLVDLQQTRGHEQSGFRPALIISENAFNHGPAGLVIVIPVTTTLRPIPSHVRIAPPEGGLQRPSAALCEAIRSISKDRLSRRLGRAAPATMARVEDAIRILMGL